MSQEIHQAIAHKNVFPPGICNEQITIINTHAGSHGYEALLAIVQMDHPVYHHHPTSYICAPPKQCKPKALSAYFNRYLNYLQLRAYLKNIDTNLNDSSELDDFIDGTLFSVEYCWLIGEDCKSQSPNIFVQFSQNRIVGTLNRLRKDSINQFDPKTRQSFGNNGVQGGKYLLPRFTRTHEPLKPSLKPSATSNLTGKPSQINT